MRKLTALALSVGAMFAFASIAGAGSNTESATGNYTLFGGQYDISFSAKATLQNTNASGHFKWTILSSDPDTVLEGDVTCLFVGPQRSAMLGGTVTSFTGPFANPATRGFFISVKDNGQGPTQLTPDTSTQPLTSTDLPPDTCTPPFVISQVPISSGDITVKPALAP